MHGANNVIAETERETEAQTIERFCARNGISRSMFYKLLNTGRGPQTMKVGTKTLISVEASAAWRRRMEMAA